jgi:hypothetical protein
MAGGISADAGLTPAQDKWILRTQIRYMQRDGDSFTMPRESEMFAFPMVVAYGLKPELTLMVRQMFMRMDMTMPMGNTKNSGLGDLLVMAKYRAYRKNTKDYTFGIAPLLGLEFPTGKDSFTSDGFDLKMGLYLSGRSGPWGSDINLSYMLNGIAGGGEDQEKNGVFEFVGALARQITIGDQARDALAPVIELAYSNESSSKVSGATVPNTGESKLMVSPGLKFTHSSIIIESLLQIPVSQSQNGNQPESGIGGLLGIRVML